MALRKTVTIELFHQPNMHVVIAIVHHSLWCEFASTFNVLTRFGLKRLMLQDVLRRVSDTLGLQFLHSTLPLVLMGIHNLVVTSAIWIEVIVFTLFIHVIYLCYKSFEYCVCQHTDPGMTHKHRDLIHSGRVATRWYQSTC